MNHYLHFTFEIFSKFANYISQDYTPENISLDPLISNELTTYILNNLLFFRNIPRQSLEYNEGEIVLLSYEKVNNYIYNLLSPSLKVFKTVISYESYLEIMSTNQYLLSLLQTNSIESIVPQTESNTPVDHGFEYDYQNSITQAILWCISSITKWLDFSMIEIKDILFIKECLHPKDYSNQIVTDEFVNENKAILQPIIENILLKHDYYITSEASDELCKLWIHLNNEPISVRLICFDQK